MDRSFSECDSNLARILDVYESLGYPRATVTQWSLPATDAADLCELAAASNARRILEVGSFVGTSAFLMAQALPRTEVFSVDPNLPLKVEFTAMAADGKGADLSRTTLDVARLTAARLGLSARVHFLEGGFAVGSTFALDDVPVPVIGRDVCQEHGPFDFAFIDGLHFEDAVVADVQLTLSALAPHGTIALHDCIGYWGSHVRRAVARILETDDSLSFTHAPYQSLTRAIGSLSRTNRQSPLLEERVRACFGDGEKLANQLARLLRSTFSNERFRACDALAQRVLFHMNQGDDEHGRVTLAFDALDAVHPQNQSNVLRNLVDGRDAVVLGLTPPGELNAAGAWARPLAQHVERLSTLGFDTYDSVTPFLEPYTHAFGGGSVIDRKTSFLLDTVIAVRRGSSCAARFSHVIPLDAPRARALTDLRLQTLFAAVSHSEMRERYIAMHDGAATLREALHIRNVETLRLGAALHEWSSWRIHLGRYRCWRRRESGQGG